MHYSEPCSAKKPKLVKVVSSVGRIVGDNGNPTLWGQDLVGPSATNYEKNTGAVSFKNISTFPNNGFAIILAFRLERAIP